MFDWREKVRALTSLGEEVEFPLLVFRAPPPSETLWPEELAAPSAGLREFYQLCDGGYFGGHHRIFSVAELLPENLRWWQMAEDHPRPVTEPLVRGRHVVIGFDESGHPLIWDQQTDQLLKFYFRDSDELEPLNLRIDQWFADLFRVDYPDDMWQQALRQLRAVCNPI